MGGFSSAIRSHTNFLLCNRGLVHSDCSTVSNFLCLLKTHTQKEWDFFFKRFGFLWRHKNRRGGGNGKSELICYIPESRSIDEKGGKGERGWQGGNGGPESDPQRSEPLLIFGEERTGTRQKAIRDTTNTQTGRAIIAAIVRSQPDEWRATLTFARRSRAHHQFIGRAETFIGAFAVDFGWNQARPLFRPFHRLDGFGRKWQ